MMVLTVIVVGIFKTTTILGNAYGAPRAPHRARVSAAGLAACKHTVRAGPLAVRGAMCLTCPACLASEPARSRDLRATRGAALPPRCPTSMPAPLAARRARCARPTRAPPGAGVAVSGMMIGTTLLAALAMLVVWDSSPLLVVPFLLVFRARP